MYKILIGLFLSVLCLQAKCQIQFDEGSFTEVLVKAKQEKKDGVYGLLHELVWSL